MSIYSIPEIPSLPDVPYISIELSSELEAKLSEYIDMEGRVIERAPIQITDIIEKPGALTVKWTEVGKVWNSEGLKNLRASLSIIIYLFSSQDRTKKKQ